MINQLTILSQIITAIGIIIFVFMIYSTIVLLKENEKYAATRVFSLLLFFSFLFIFLGLASFKYQQIISLILLVLTAIVVLIFIVPVRKRYLPEDGTPKARLDERDIMLSRDKLVPGTERFEQYYSENPDKKIVDDKFREEPGLFTKGADKYEPYSISAAVATFTTVERLRQYVAGEVSPDKIASDPHKLTLFIKNWAKKMGAVSVGVTELKDYHLYSITGRGGDFGKPIELDHAFAIALTVEMDHEMVQYSPLAPAMMETAQQYQVSGSMAIQIAEFIRTLGYSARAHIDGKYQVVCPVVAKDAGLGEIGRMGLLMTPELGPRVRVAVVTTDLPLITDKRTFDYSVIDFCTQCKKCADVCPGRAIPFEDRIEIDGVRRWQVNQEKCYTIWCKFGTDCNRCVSVCPYSHPDNFLHNSIRRGIQNSALFRKFALKLDDFFYGKKPVPKELAEWLKL